MNAPIFVTGYGRSGTTLVQGILAAHPDVALKTENNVLYNLLRAGHDLRAPCTPAAAAAALTRSARVGEQVKTFLAAAGDLEGLFAAAGATCLRDAVEALLRQGETAGRWGDKSLMTALALPKIAAAWPEMRVVHLVRDPRDVALSFFRKHAARLEGADSVEDRPATWRDWAVLHAHARRWQHWNRTFEATRTAQCLLVRYEDLVTAPDETVAKMCRFLDLQPDPAMLDATARGALARHPAHRRVTEPISGARVGQWSALPDLLIRCIEDACPMMETYGYARSSRPGFSVAQVLSRIAATRRLRHLPGLPEPVGH